MEPTPIAFEGIEPIQSLVAEEAEDDLLGVHLEHHHASVVMITLNNIWEACMEPRNVVFVHVETVLILHAEVQEDAPLDDQLGVRYGGIVHIFCIRHHTWTKNSPYLAKNN